METAALTKPGQSRRLVPPNVRLPLPAATSSTKRLRFREATSICAQANGPLRCAETRKSWF